MFKVYRVFRNGIPNLARQGTYLVEPNWVTGVTIDSCVEATNQSQLRVVPAKMNIEAFHVVGG
jgi:hypothetical protein